MSCSLNVQTDAIAIFTFLSLVRYLSQNMAEMDIITVRVLKKKTNLLWSILL